MLPKASHTSSRRCLEAGIVGDVASRGKRPASESLDCGRRGPHLLPATPRWHHVGSRQSQSSAKG